MHLDGYFHKEPVRGKIEFLHDVTEGIKWSAYQEELTKGQARVVGSPAIRDMVCPRENIQTLDAGTELIKKVILAHYPENEVRHLCPEVPASIWPYGGRMHVATITPEAGFSWVAGFEPSTHL